MGNPKEYDDFIRNEKYSGYNKKVKDVRNKEYSRLKDNAGNPLYLESLLDVQYRCLKTNIFSNPHSLNDCSKNTLEKVQNSRSYLLKLFNANSDEYVCIFLSNVTQGAKIIGECFPWNQDGRFYCCSNSHTSIVGIREYALRKNSKYITFDANDLSTLDISKKECYDLVAHSKQDHFSGTQVDNFTFTENAIRLIDYSSYCSTNKLNIDKETPDFALISLYKILGIPTGLSILVAKKRALKILDPVYFGGGTISSLSFKEQWHQFKDEDFEETKWENGSLNFLDIAIIPLLFDQFLKVYNSFESIYNHVQSLYTYLLDSLNSLTYENLQPLVIIYSGLIKNVSQNAPIISFNLLNSRGRYISPTEVQNLLNLKSIYVRAGALCAPGLIEKSLNLSGFRCGSEIGLLNHFPMGVIRVSIGAFNSFDDIFKLVEFLQEHFLKVQDPFKSCAPLISDRSSWEIIDTGFFLDRKWIIINSDGDRAMTLKRYPKLAKITPTFIKYEEEDRIILKFEDFDDFELEIPKSTKDSVFYKEIEVNLLNLKPTFLFIFRIKVISYEKAHPVNEWLERVLSIKCYLAYQKKETVGENEFGKTSLSNESQFLLIVQNNIDKIRSSTPNVFHENGLNFRPNLVVNFPDVEFLDEENWSHVFIGAQKFQVIGKCRRCNAICVDPISGEKSILPYSSLLKDNKESVII